MMQYTMVRSDLPFRGGALPARRDFQQVKWDDETVDDCRHILRLAVREELDRGQDLTTLAIVPGEAQGAAQVVVRQPGVVAGLPAVDVLIEEMNLQAKWHASLADGEVVRGGTPVGRIAGSTRDLLTAERILLNLLGHLSGIATLTQRFVAQIAGTAAHIYDTRKTIPGWRRLEKYAVRCGGGRNHRTGLFDAVLIKDNHLAQTARRESIVLSPAQAVRMSRQFLAEYFADADLASVLIEVEVETLSQFDDAMAARPDIILLDNMSTPEVRECVERRNQTQATTELEASGGITLDNIRTIAETGVDRISVGAITHSAPTLDVGMDWEM